MGEIITYLIIIVLLVLSGLFSGLNLGLLSLDKFQLRRKIKLGDARAKKLYPLREKGNLLLVTILIGNTLINSILAVFLGSITFGIIAVVLSTGLIVLFGEIIPQAVFSRHALTIGSKLSWFVWFFLFLLYPLAKPIAFMLDLTLGKELPTVFSRKELKLIIKEQEKNKKSKIPQKEFEIIGKSLNLSQRRVKNILTPRVKVFFLKDTQILTKELLKEIYRRGHTRIPVYSKNRDKVVGLIYTKDLILLDPEDKTPVKKVMRKKLFYVKEQDKIENVMEKARKESVHLFIVKDKYGGVSGIVTLEDILEEVVGEITDEFDIVEKLKSNVNES